MGASVDWGEWKERFVEHSIYEGSAVSGKLVVPAYSLVDPIMKAKPTLGFA